MKRILIFILIILTITILPVSAADDTASASSALSSAGNMYIISGSTAPQYAASYEDVYSSLVSGYIDSCDSTAHILSPDSILNVTESAYQGSKGLCVNPYSSEQSRLVLDISNHDFSNYKYLMFAVNIPDGIYKLGVRITSLPDGSGNGVFSYTSESIAPGGYGWQIVLCDISRLLRSSMPSELEITFSHNVPSVQTLPEWYIDGIGVSSDGGAAKVLRYLSSDYFAANARIYTDLNSIRLNVTAPDPYIESASVYPQVFANADSVEIQFSSSEPVDALRVYYADSTAPVFDISRSVYKDVHDDGQYKIMTFGIGNASQLRIVFEGVSTGTITVHSIRPVTAGADESGRLGTISSCELGESRRFTVKGQLSSETAEQFRHLRLGLFELRTPSDIPLLSQGQLKPLATVRVSENFSLTASLYDGERSMLTSAFAVGIIIGNGTTAAPVGVPVYITNPDLLRTSTWSYPETASKKGLSAGSLDDVTAVLDGVRHTVLDTVLSELFSSDESGIKHIYNGNEYYFDTAAVTALDERITELYYASVNVRLRILCGNYKDGKFPLYSDSYVGFELSYADTRDMFAAAFDFLAGRYSDSDRTHGRVVGYILGHEVTDTVRFDPSYFNTAETAADYADALRIMSTAAGVHGDARIYLEITGSWESVTGREMNNRALLETLARLTEIGGDFCWGVMLDPYPKTQGVYCSWMDVGLSDDFDAQYITTKNIKLLCDFLERSDMRCGRGDIRHIILNSTTPGKVYAPMEEMTAAAEFVLAYYKLNTRECAAVECLIIEPLYSYNDIFRAVDTDATRTVSDFAMEVIGIGDWRELFDGYDETLIVRRSTQTTEFADKSLLPESEHILFDGSDGELPLTGFTVSSGLSALKYIRDTASDTAYGTKLIDGAAMMAKLDGSGSAVTSAQTLYPLDLSMSGWLSFRVQVSSLPHGVSSAPITVMLCSGDSMLTASGTVHEGGWNDIALDISPFTASGRRIDRVRIIAGGDDTGEAIFYVSPISVRSDTLSSSELANLFQSQRDSYFKDPVREYDMKLIMIVGGVGIFAALLFLLRRIRPYGGKREEDDFTDMEIWKQ